MSAANRGTLTEGDNLFLSPGKMSSYSIRVVKGIAKDLNLSTIMEEGHTIAIMMPFDNLYISVQANPDICQEYFCDTSLLKHGGGKLRIVFSKSLKYKNVRHFLCPEDFKSHLENLLRMHDTRCNHQFSLLPIDEPGLTYSASVAKSILQDMKLSVTEIAKDGMCASTLTTALPFDELLLRVDTDVSESFCQTSLMFKNDGSDSKIDDIKRVYNKELGYDDVRSFNSPEEFRNHVTVLLKSSSDHIRTFSTDKLSIE